MHAPFRQFLRRSFLPSVLLSLRSLCQTNGIIAQVIHRIPASEEGISQDGERSDRSREVHAHESADARALNLENVIIRCAKQRVSSSASPRSGNGRLTSDGKAISREFKTHFGERISLVTLDRLLLDQPKRGTWKAPHDSRIVR